MEVVLIEPPLNPIANGEKYAEMLFEKYNVPAISIIPSVSLFLI